jgi:hypothetical protein
LASDVLTLEDRVREEAIQSGKEFLPSVELVKSSLMSKHAHTPEAGAAAGGGGGGSKLSGEDLLTKIRDVINSLKHQMLDKKLENIDRELVNQVSI